MLEVDLRTAETRSPSVALAHAPAPGQSRLLRVAEELLEPVVTVSSLWLLVWLHDLELGPAWLIASVVVFALAYPGRRQLQLSWQRAAAATLIGWLWTAGLLLAMAVATGQMGAFDPGVVLTWLWFAPVSQLLAHGALRSAAPHLMRLQGPPLKAVVVGLNEQGCTLSDRLATSWDTGVELVGYFDDRTPERLHGADRHRFLGRLADLAPYAKTHRLHLIYLSLPMASQPRIKSLLDELKDTTSSIYFVPDMFVTDLIQGRVQMVCGLPVISVCETPFRGPEGLLKRISDVVLASLILALISPVLLAIAAAIKLSSPGPVIFRQRRYGLEGEEIIVYKFRSMTVTEDGDVIQQARKTDTRVTPLGAFLRKTSMDELPQFINVLQGRMSIVGPRPHAVAHNEMYRRLIKSYMVRHKVRPGITGWAQVNGFRGETDTLEKMEGRVRCDLEYLRNWSLRLDLYIIWRTVRLVFRDSAAY
jgi:putative colanic acid biosynthesis UDP-glucose lipid carrier transferase